MTQHAIARKPIPSPSRSAVTDHLVQRPAIHLSQSNKSASSTALEPRFQVNLAQVPLQPSALIQQKPDPTRQRSAYQIAAPKPSDNGYQEIAAISGDTHQPIGRVKIKGSPVQQKMEIASLWVAPEHRQQGVSKSLISAATQEGKKQGYRQARLGVDPEAPGMSTSTLEGIYARQGFKKTGTIGQNNPLMERSL